MLIITICLCCACARVNPPVADPHNADDYNHRGSVYAFNDQHDLAIADFSKAIELNPQNIKFYCSRGLSYDLKGQYDLAIADYNKAIELNPKDQFAYTGKAISYEKSGRKSEAIQTYIFILQYVPHVGDELIKQKIKDLGGTI